MRLICNNYAPKCAELKGAPNSHGVFYRRCNFHCSFCNLRNDGDDGADVTQQIIDAIPQGKNFKFSGGEPTLNPRLGEYLRLAKSFGGEIFLDTNGSNPTAVRRFLEEGLVDVLGISLKGLTPEEAEQTAGVRRQFCWDNTLQSIRYGLDSTARTIITLVIKDGEDIPARLEAFYALFHDSDYVYYKLNNLFESRKSEQQGMHSADEDSLAKEIAAWVERHPDICGRVIYVPNKSGVGHYETIQFY